MTTINLRSYDGFGKFEGGLAIDPVAYDLSLNGCDNDCGDVSERGIWYGLLRGSLAPCATARLDNELNDEECAFMANAAGCIVSENDQGFVNVLWFDKSEANDMESQWSEIMASMEPADEAAD